MKVFISHSLTDTDLLQQVVNKIKEWGYEPVCCENTVLTDTITQKIKDSIDSSDYGLVIYTESASKSAFVNQEIGYLKKTDKPIFIIREADVELLGFIYGYDSIMLNKNGKTCISKLKQSLDTYNVLLRQEIAKEKQTRAIVGTLAGVGIVALISN